MVWVCPKAWYPKATKTFTSWNRRLCRLCAPRARASRHARLRSPKNVLRVRLAGDAPSRHLSVKRFPTIRLLKETRWFHVPCWATLAVLVCNSTLGPYDVYTSLRIYITYSTEYCLHYFFGKIHIATTSSCNCFNLSLSLRLWIYLYSILYTSIKDFERNTSLKCFFCIWNLFVGTFLDTLCIDLHRFAFLFLRNYFDNAFCLLPV